MKFLEHCPGEGEIQYKEEGETTPACLKHGVFYINGLTDWIPVEYCYKCGGKLSDTKK